MGLGTCKCYYRTCNWSIQQKYDVTTGKFSLMSMIWFNLVQALALLIAYGIVTPIGDRLQFAQAWSYLYAQSFVAGVANFITICNWRNPPSCNLC